MTTQENPDPETPQETTDEQSAQTATEPIHSSQEEMNAEEIEPEEEDGPDAEGAEGIGGRPEEQLQGMLEGAKTARLSPTDEDGAVQLLKRTVAGGPKALGVTIDAILTLPWAASVRAVTDAWPETKPAGRARLLVALAKADSDISRRVRLSLARGLHTQDAASALKLVQSVCEAMGGAQGGSSTKDRQIFANVMLGKARPWLMNIPLGEMKPAEAHKFITPALESCAQAPIFTQIWVLRWICDAEKFDTLPPEHIESIGKSINRWQPRWKKELRKIIVKLPDSLEAVLNDSPSLASAVAQLNEIAESQPARESAEAAQAEEEDDENDDEDKEDEPSSEGEGEARPSRRQPEARRLPERSSSRDRQAPFDFTRSLRDIEAYVARLRTELQQAQSTARRREPERSDRHRGRAAQPASAEELEEMRRHNHQLEEQNQELRHRIEDLLSDHEDRAATIDAGEPLEQFKTYLGLKLKEDFADYMAISRESLNEVVRRHAHEILGRIFTLLQSEGVKFDKEG
jgi:hypothetical protein